MRRSVTRLSHPRIVSVYDFGKVEALHYLVMEYVDGPNLRQVIKTASLSPQEALAVVPQICDALQYAHDQGVVHRDIKPENILFDKRGGVKIADFGLAKLIDKDRADQTLTKPQQVMGTLRYMAPEQMETPLDVDHRADIYSLGVVFYEMLTGEVPMGSFDLPSQRVEVDVRLDQVVLRALERNREARYQQVKEMKTGVEEASRADASTAQKQPQADSNPEPTPTPSRRRGWRKVAMGIGFVAAASVAAVLLRLITGPPPPMTSAAPARRAAELAVRMARQKARPLQVAAAPGSTREAFTVKGISDVKIDVAIHAESTKTLALYIAERNWASGPVGEGENAVATLEVSNQIRLEGGGLGHGMIFGRRASKQFLAITKDGQIPYGKVKIRETGAISRTPDAIIVADIEAMDGSRTPISLKLE